MSSRSDDTAVINITSSSALALGIGTAKTHALLRSREKPFVSNRIHEQFRSKRGECMQFLNTPISLHFHLGVIHTIL